MLLRKQILRLLLVGLTAALFCSPAQAAETIRINGSGSALDMMKPLIAAYKKLHPGVRIVMEKPLGSSGAVKALLAGSLNLVASSKPLKPEEIALGALSRDYGRTPLVIVTGKSVRKADITSKELIDIYNGKTTAWPDGVRLRLVLRPQSDIDTAILRSLSPEMDRAVSAAQERPGMLVAVTDPEANETIARTPGAIGASALCGLLVEQPPLSPLSLNGVRASAQTLAAGHYPLAKKIQFVTIGKTSAPVEELLAFIYSPTGRAIAAKVGVLVTAPKIQAGK